VNSGRCISAYLRVLRNLTRFVVIFSVISTDTMGVSYPFKNVHTRQPLIFNATESWEFLECVNVNTHFNFLTPQTTEYDFILEYVLNRLS